jgi:hypothetical protein
VQLRYECGLTSTQYVSSQAWRDATLERCPLHPTGGCHFTRHGSYARKSPAGARIARWYCRTAHCTFSLLPDCLAARFSGTLADVEAAVDELEQAASHEAAAETVRQEIDLPGALRWMRRRSRAVYAALTIIKSLLTLTFEQSPATLEGFRLALGVEAVLVTLRDRVAHYLPQLPAPLGFRFLSQGAKAKNDKQHATGPDPPRR